jgi:23S rRNA maturation mini-RNase III
MKINYVIYIYIYIYIYKMISKVKTKKTCKRLKLVNSQKGGFGNPHGQKKHKVTTKNVKKVVQSAFLRNFTDNYVRQNPSQIRKRGKKSNTIPINKFYRNAYKEYIKNYQGLTHVLPSANKLKKAVLRMNKFNHNKKYGLQEIYTLLQKKTNPINKFALLQQKPLLFSTETNKMLPNVLSHEIDSDLKYYVRFRSLKKQKKLINKISSIVNPGLYQPQKK